MEDDQQPRSIDGSPSDPGLQPGTIAIVPWKYFAQSPGRVFRKVRPAANPEIPKESLFLPIPGVEDHTRSYNGTTWAVRVYDAQDLSYWKTKLTAFPIFLLVNIVRQIRPSVSEAPFLLMIYLEKEINAVFKRLSELNRKGEKFLVKLDFNPCVDRWSSSVLRTEGSSTGGAICFTNTDLKDVPSKRLFPLCSCGTGSQISSFNQVVTFSHSVVTLSAQPEDIDDQRSWVKYYLETLHNDEESRKESGSEIKQNAVFSFDSIMSSSSSSADQGQHEAITRIETCNQYSLLSGDESVCDETALESNSAKADISIDSDVTKNSLSAMGKEGETPSPERKESTLSNQEKSDSNAVILANDQSTEVNDVVHEIAIADTEVKTSTVDIQTQQADMNLELDERIPQKDSTSIHYEETVSPQVSLSLQNNITSPDEHKLEGESQPSVDSPFVDGKDLSKLSADSSSITFEDQSQKPSLNVDASTKDSVGKDSMSVTMQSPDLEAGNGTSIVPLKAAELDVDEDNILAEASQPSITNEGAHFELTHNEQNASTTCHLTYDTEIPAGEKDIQVQQHPELIHRGLDAEENAVEVNRTLEIHAPDTSINNSDSPLDRDLKVYATLPSPEKTKIGLTVELDSNPSNTESNSISIQQNAELKTPEMNVSANGIQNDNNEGGENINHDIDTENKLICKDEKLEYTISNNLPEKDQNEEINTVKTQGHNIKFPAVEVKHTEISTDSSPNSKDLEVKNDSVLQKTEEEATNFTSAPLENVEDRPEPEANTDMQLKASIETADETPDDILSNDNMKDTNFQITTNVILKDIPESNTNSPESGFHSDEKSHMNDIIGIKSGSLVNNVEPTHDTVDLCLAAGKADSTEHAATDICSDVPESKTEGTISFEMPIQQSSTVELKKECDGKVDNQSNDKDYEARINYSIIEANTSLENQKATCENNDAVANYAVKTEIHASEDGKENGQVSVDSLECKTEKINSNKSSITINTENMSIAHKDVYTVQGSIVSLSKTNGAENTKDISSDVEVNEKFDPRNSVSTTPTNLESVRSVTEIEPHNQDQETVNGNHIDATVYISSGSPRFKDGKDQNDNYKKYKKPGGKEVLPQKQLKVKSKMKNSDNTMKWNAKSKIDTGNLYKPKVKENRTVSKNKTQPVKKIKTKSVVGVTFDTRSSSDIVSSSESSIANGKETSHLNGESFDSNDETAIINEIDAMLSADADADAKIVTDEEIDDLLNSESQEDEENVDVRPKSALIRDRHMSPVKAEAAEIDALLDSVSPDSKRNVSTLDRNNCKRSEKSPKKKKILARSDSMDELDGLLHEIDVDEPIRGTYPKFKVKKEEDTGIKMNGVLKVEDTSGCHDARLARPRIDTPSSKKEQDRPKTVGKGCIRTKAEIERRGSISAFDTRREQELRSSMSRRSERVVGNRVPGRPSSTHIGKARKSITEKLRGPFLSPYFSTIQLAPP